MIIIGVVSCTDVMEDNLLQPTVGTATQIEALAPTSTKVSFNDEIAEDGQSGQIAISWAVGDQIKIRKASENVDSAVTFNYVSGNIFEGEYTFVEGEEYIAIFSNRTANANSYTYQQNGQSLDHLNDLVEMQSEFIYSQDKVISFEHTHAILRLKYQAVGIPTLLRYSDGINSITVNYVATTIAGVNYAYIPLLPISGERNVVVEMENSNSTLYRFEATPSGSYEAGKVYVGDITFDGGVIIAPTTDNLIVNGSSGGYIDFGSNDTGYTGNTSTTIEFWVKMTDAHYQGQNAIYSFLTTFSENNNEDRQGWFINTMNGLMRVSYGGGGGNLWEPSFTCPDLHSNWAHIAVVTETSSDLSLKFYINGELVKEEVGSGVPYQASTKGYSMYAFAGIQSDGTNESGRGATGSMKHLHIWDTAKSQDEIKALMNQETVVIGTESDLVAGWEMDSKPSDGVTFANLKAGGNNAVVKGSYSWDSDTIQSDDAYELYVEGTNVANRGFIDFGIDEAYSNNTKSTIEFWLKMADSRYTSEFVTTLTTFSEENGGTDRRGWFVNHHSGNLRMSYGAGTGLQEPSSSSPSLSAWTHVAMVTDMSDDKTGYKWKMYINGELYSQWPNDDVYQDFGGTYQTGVARMLAFMSVTPDGTIDTDKACNGYIKHLHLWSSIKTQDEIKTIMNDPTVVIGSEDDLIGGWGLCEKPEDGVTIPNIKNGGNSAIINGAYQWVATIM